ERANHPSYARGDVTRQRNYFTLDIDATVLLFHTPPGFHAPEKSAISPRFLFPFIAFSGILYFRNFCRAASAVSPLGGIPERFHVVSRVQYNGDYLVAAKPQKSHIMIAVVFQRFRTLHIGFIVLGMVIVILEHSQNVVHRRTRYIGNRLPVVNHSIW